MLLEPQVSGRVVVLMGSTSDMAHCEKIKKACVSFGISCSLRVTSAHKGPDETLRIKAEYEGEHQFLGFCAQWCPGFHIRPPLCSVPDENNHVFNLGDIMLHARHIPSQELLEYDNILDNFSSFGATCSLIKTGLLTFLTLYNYRFHL